MVLDFIFTISASSAYKAIGNAVPPVLAWNIARSVIYTLDNIN
ncbi:DNA cytosine methyltransferase [Ligilactobacillus salivarius]|nr:MULTISPECIES: DNA cytosine methyltransferase [Lactobacillales]MDW3023971.1 DNA cytosine methyltransferase [Ligilactobacillus salivarius]